MLQKPRTAPRRRRLAYHAENDAEALLQLLPVIRALADSDKEALGFLPEAAYREAVEKQRLIAMCSGTRESAKVVGFILFSGVFPNARIQQVVVSPQHRREGIGSALINPTFPRFPARLV